MYRIEQQEPEGWAKAYVIFFGSKRITHCSYMDTAADLIRTFNCQE